MLEQHHLTLVYVAIHFHKHTNVHLEHCQGHRVFKLYRRTGDVHLGILYQERRVCAQLILLDIRVQVEEVW